MIVRDGGIDDIARSEKLRYDEAGLVGAGNPHDFLLMPIRGGEVNESAHWLTTLSPLIVAPAIVSPLIENDSLIAWRA